MENKRLWHYFCIVSSMLTLGMLEVMPVFKQKHMEDLKEPSNWKMGKDVLLNHLSGSCDMCWNSSTGC